jgi:hypothetical protein
MTCDKVLSALAAGGLFGRWRARRHAARCPRCATVINELENMVGELSAVPALTPAERQLWLRACDDVPLVSRYWPRLTRPALAAAVVAAVVIPVGMWLNSRPMQIKSRPAVITVVDTKFTRAESLRVVDEIQTGVVGLIRELDQLQSAADLLDARRDVEALELRFAPRTAFDDF